MTDRENVIRALEVCSSVSDGEECPKECPYMGQDVYCIGSSGLMLDALDLLKEQEPKTGKWILDDEDANSWECSECGGLTVINDGTPHENNWYFCPNCGAKLEEQVMKME